MGKAAQRRITIDLSRAGDVAAMHETIAKRLRLGPDYGRNFDALYDALTEYGTGWKLTFKGVPAFAAALKDVCADAAAATPGLEIAFR